MLIYGISPDGRFYAADTDTQIGEVFDALSTTAVLARMATDSERAYLAREVTDIKDHVSTATHTLSACYTHALDVARESECTHCGKPHNGAADRLCSDRCRAIVAAQRERAHLVATRTCPGCRKPGALSRKQASQGLQCNACADHDERRASVGA